MTIDDLERIGEQIAIQKAAGHSSKAKVHINQLERLIQIARDGIAVSELERSAARTHMERNRRTRSFSA